MKYHRDLSSKGFGGYRTVRHLRNNGLADVPLTPGVLAIIRPMGEAVKFRQSSPAGRYRGIDPTQSTEFLRTRWIEGAEVLYIGKTDVTLRDRISRLLRFGAGKPIAGYGGRLVWQLADADDLAFAWRELGRNANLRPADLKRSLIVEFRHQNGDRPPFANIG